MSLVNLFFVSFLASTLLPGGSEVYFSYLVHESHISWILLISVASIGNSIGGFSNWLIGRFIESQWSIKSKGKKVQRTRDWIEKWGAPILLLSWLPVVGDPLCLAAGYLRVHWLKSILYIMVGKTMRYSFLYYLISPAV